MQQNELNAAKPEEEIVEIDDMKNTEQNDDDVQANENLQELSKFYEKFAEKMIAFDPLDRPIPDEGNDQMTKRDQLVKILEEDMAQYQISGYLLNAPMGNDIYDVLMNLFDKTEKECIEIGEQYINEAKTQGVKFTEKFDQN